MGSVLYGRWSRGWHPAAWLLGGLGLYFAWWYAPAVDVLSDAELVFYGGSMLLAAVLGYAGCEVFAVANRLLHRDDQVGCAPFWPVDAVEATLAGRRRAAQSMKVRHAG